MPDVSGAEMGRAKMTLPDSNPETETTNGLGLPLKIAGIVFWGLVLIGLFLSAFAIEWLRTDIQRQGQLRANKIILSTQALINRNPKTDIGSLQVYFEELIHDSGVAGLNIKYDLNEVSVGDTSDDLSSQENFFNATGNQSVDLPQEKFIVTVFQVPTEALFNEQKKQFMLILGLVFFSFGLVLQFILKQLISRPIEKMVKTAQHCSNGIDKKFDESRNDEFGYLARFINKALTNLNLRKQQLTASLERTQQSEKETRLLTKQLRHQANHDALTGLCNRSMFEVRLKQALTETANGQTQITLCYLDLDQFKVVNDTCGHVAGDELLRRLAQLLKAELHEKDTIARLGGDEFGVLIRHRNLEEASKIASRLRKTVRDFHFTWEGKLFQIGVSIGVVPLTTSIQNVIEALSTADVACYAAKDQGRDRVHVYEADDEELRRRRKDMQWVSHIREALRENRFCLYVQPIVPINKNDCNKMHLEVLIRMLDEDGTIIEPGKFLGAAEQYGLMPAIDRWVMRNAFAWISSNRDTLNVPHKLAINLSGQSISANNFLDTLLDEMHKSGVDPKQLCFEITETAAIANLDKARTLMEIVKEMGCEFALDDFGSGMSSFSYLKVLPVDYLKIDGSYVRDLVTDPVDRAMVEAVNQIGHAMDMQTIAEFVESEATMGALAAIGVDFAQGYALGKPQPIEDALPIVPAKLALTHA